MKEKPAHPKVLCSTFKEITIFLITYTSLVVEKRQFVEMKVLLGILNVFSEKLYVP